VGQKPLGLAAWRDSVVPGASDFRIEMIFSSEFYGHTIFATRRGSFSKARLIMYPSSWPSRRSPVIGERIFWWGRPGRRAPDGWRNFRAMETPIFPPPLLWPKNRTPVIHRCTMAESSSVLAGKRVAMQRVLDFSRGTIPSGVDTL